jgi:hypothetical protein
MDCIVPPVLAVALACPSQSGGMGHAGRHVANAGVANGKVFERSFLGGPRAAWGSQNPKGEWPCRARGAAPPREVWLPYSARVARKQNEGGRCGKERPAEEGGGRCEAAGAREEETPPLESGFYIDAGLNKARKKLDSWM